MARIGGPVWRQHQWAEATLIAALDRVRVRLAEGTLPHFVTEGEEEMPDLIPKGQFFNMGVGLYQGNEDEKLEVLLGECGTVCCIGGWLALELGLPDGEVNGFVNVAPESWARLFMPTLIYDWSKITPAEAIVAIDRFKAGFAPWDELSAGRYTQGS